MTDRNGRPGGHAYDFNFAPHCSVEHPLIERNEFLAENHLQPRDFPAKDMDHAAAFDVVTEQPKWDVRILPPGVEYRTPADTGDKLRKDDGKARFDLLPPEALFALCDLYAFGAKKYAPRGWEEGMHWGRCFGALMRHAWKFWRGEDYDAETGAHHMIAVAWNAIAIYTYFVRKIGTDDRAGAR